MVAADLVGTSPRFPIIGVPETSWGKMGVGGMEGDKGIVMEDVREDDMQNLGGRLLMVLMLMREWC